MAKVWVLYMKKHKICILLALISLSTVKANVSLPKIFSDHMVLQQNSHITVWGWGQPVEEVRVIASWNQKEVKDTVNSLGEWSVTLSTPDAGGPYTLTITEFNTILLKDILIGEVWLCSGQSNMEMMPRWGIDHGTEEVMKADNPAIRFFRMGLRSSNYPQLDSQGEWKRCTPQTMFDFSAIAYFFGQRLYDSLKCPIGLIDNAWGGTPIEVWMPPNTPEVKKVAKNMIKLFAGFRWSPIIPGSVYNSMIIPLLPFKIAGVIWFQGEANTRNPKDYIHLFPALIRSWRNGWGYNFPFYYVQIAPFRYGKNRKSALVKEAQLKTLSLPNTGMVVVSDISDPENIHSKNKKDVGVRLANWALAKTYGKKQIVFSGPLYRGMKLEGNKIRIFFDHVADHLVCRGEKLTDFKIAGADKKFINAEAVIDNKTVLVFSKKVEYPVAVRFACDNTAVPNLFNNAGLPASCFRTDDWEIK